MRSEIFGVGRFWALSQPRRKKLLGAPQLFPVPPIPNTWRNPCIHTILLARSDAVHHSEEAQGASY